MKKKEIFIKCFVVVICLFIVLFLYIEDNKKYIQVSYKTFVDSLQNNEIKEVNIEDKLLYFEKKNCTEFYKTQNPKTPFLKENLLLHDIVVKENKNIENIISIVFDIVFYVIFFGILIYIFRKFISPNTFKVMHNTGKKFSDVIGMNSLKKDMKLVIDIMQNPVGYYKKGIRMPRGILLEGEPGNGKTLFAKALAGEANINFIPTKATDFESMFMSVGPMKVKLLFKKARSKAPCIVFIDEFDGIGTKRNYSGSAIETENTRIVTALLNELDGFEPTEGVFIIAATNSIQALDTALIRPGRFDSRFTVPYPDKDARIQLIKMYTDGKKMDTDCSYERLSDLFSGFSCAKIESVLNRASLICIQRNTDRICFDYIFEAVEELKNAK